MMNVRCVTTHVFILTHRDFCLPRPCQRKLNTTSDESCKFVQGFQYDIYSFDGLTKNTSKVSTRNGLYMFDNCTHEKRSGNYVTIDPSNRWQRIVRNFNFHQIMLCRHYFRSKSIVGRTHHWNNVVWNLLNHSLGKYQSVSNILNHIEFTITSVICKPY